MSATPPAEIEAAIAATRAAGTAKIRRAVRRDTAAGPPSLADFGGRQSHPLCLLRGGIGWRPEVDLRDGGIG